MTYHKICWLDYVCKEIAENAWKIQPGIIPYWVTCKNCIKYDKNANPIPPSTIDLSFTKLPEHEM